MTTIRTPSAYFEALAAWQERPKRWRSELIASLRDQGAATTTAAANLLAAAALLEEPAPPKPCPHCGHQTGVTGPDICPSCHVQIAHGALCCPHCGWGVAFR